MNIILRKHMIFFTSMNENVNAKTAKSSKSVTAGLTRKRTIGTVNSRMFSEICNSVRRIRTRITIILKYSKGLFVVPHVVLRQGNLRCKPFRTPVTSEARYTTCRKLILVIFIQFLAQKIQWNWWQTCTLENYLTWFDPSSPLSWCTVYILG